MKNKQIVMGIVIGAGLILLMFLVGKMAYDEGYASGSLKSMKMNNDCLDRCSVNINATTRQYRQGCYNLCLSQGRSGYQDVYPPFPF